MNNLEIREAFRKAGLHQWQVAEVYGLHEGNFSRLLRKELDENTKNQILEIVEQLRKKGVA